VHRRGSQQRGHMRFRARDIAGARGRTLAMMHISAIVGHVETHYTQQGRASGSVYCTHCGVKVRSHEGVCLF